jgi:hypothetical protein
MQHRPIPAEFPPVAKGGEGGFETQVNPPQSPFSKGGGSGEHYENFTNTRQNRGDSRCITFAVLYNMAAALPPCVSMIVQNPEIFRGNLKGTFAVPVRPAEGEREDET